MDVLFNSDYFPGTTETLLERYQRIHKKPSRPACDVRYMGITRDGKTLTEKDTLPAFCVEARKLPIPQKTVSVLCRTCLKSQIEIPPQTIADDGVTVNKQDRRCFCHSIHYLNQRNKILECRAISHSQACRWMQDWLESVEALRDGDPQHSGRKK